MPSRPMWSSIRTCPRPGRAAAISPPRTDTPRGGSPCRCNRLFWPTWTVLSARPLRMASGWWISTWIMDGHCRSKRLPIHRASPQLEHLGQDNLGAFHLLDDDAQAFGVQRLFFLRHALERVIDQAGQRIRLDMVEVDIEQALDLE